MSASAVYTTHSSISPLVPLSATSVNAARHIARPSIELKISNSGTKIVNAVVADATGRPLYSISSNSKHTKLLSQKGNTEVATVNWDRSSPRMVLRGKKFKCKDWLPLVRPDTDSRLLVHGDTQFTWMQRSSSGSLIPASRSGLAVAKWRTKSGTDELRLKIFQEALVEPGLLDAIVLSIVLLQSGNSFGDGDPITSMGPKYYGYSLADVTYMPATS